jgi:hypothetical protein
MKYDLHSTKGIETFSRAELEEMLIDVDDIEAAITESGWCGWPEDPRNAEEWPTTAIVHHGESLPAEAQAFLKGE